MAKTTKDPIPMINGTITTAGGTKMKVTNRLHPDIASLMMMLAAMGDPTREVLESSRALLALFDKKPDGAA